MRRIGGIITRWKQFRAGHMVAHGAIFWIAFWGGALAVIAWLYTPGGLGDPTRDLHQPTTQANRFACAKPCNKPAQEPAAPTNAAPGRGVRTTTTGAPTPEPSTGPTHRPITLPTAPTVKPPKLAIDIDDITTTAGNRYLHYRVTVTAVSSLDTITLTTDIPAGTYYSECRDQAGQQICVDQRKGEREGHWLTTTLSDVSAGERQTLDFWVHVDAVLAEGTEVLNHAHATWTGGATRTGDLVYRVGESL